ncbi:TPA: transposase domain-containing protein [Pseudomonas aeruginosa]|nr:transposase domain-containing protein [Pseudomonas aeruginosa]
MQSAKHARHDPWFYLKNVLERLQGHPNNTIDELLPHRWEPAADTMPIRSASRERA